MELGTAVPQRSLNERRILFGSICLVLGLGAVLLFAGGFDGLGGVRLARVPSTPIAAVQVAQVPSTQIAAVQLANATEKAAKQGTCESYKICKCQVAEQQSDGYSACAAGSCTYSPSAWSACSLFTPDCSRGMPDWQHCEWANAPGKYPGQEYFVQLEPWIVGLIPYHGTSVFTDKDDTITCSGGFPGGVDKTCLGTRKKGMYPGVAQFMLALARGPRDVMNPPKVVPLSARTEELNAFMTMVSHSSEGSTFHRVGAAEGVTADVGGQWGLDTENAGYGSVYDFMDVAAEYTHDTDLTPFDRMGYRKFTNWQRIRTEMGRFTAFVGDNGQGDLVAAQMMLKQSESLRADEGYLFHAFIHDVRNSCTSTACKQAWANLGVVYFANYGEAATIAYDYGVISLHGCQSVCSEFIRVGLGIYCNCDGKYLERKAAAEKEKMEKEKLGK